MDFIGTTWLLFTINCSAFYIFTVISIRKHKWRRAASQLMQWHQTYDCPNFCQVYKTCNSIVIVEVGFVTACDFNWLLQSIIFIKVFYNVNVCFSSASTFTCGTGKIIDKIAKSSHRNLSLTEILSIIPRENVMFQTALEASHKRKHCV